MLEKAILNGVDTTRMKSLNTIIKRTSETEKTGVNEETGVNEVIGVNEAAEAAESTSPKSILMMASSESLMARETTTTSMTTDLQNPEENTAKSLPRSTRSRDSSTSLSQSHLSSQASPTRSRSSAHSRSVVLNPSEMIEKRKLGKTS